MKNFILIFAVTISFSACPQSFIEKLAGKAFTTNSGYEMLREVCDNAGGRMMGSPGMDKALEILSRRLEQNGLKPFREYFISPAWFRGNDEVVMKLPYEKKFRAFALSWVSPANLNGVEAIYVNAGYDDDFDTLDVKGKVILVDQKTPPGKPERLRAEVIKAASAKGAAACLFVNEAQNGKVLCGVGNFKGTPLKIPAFTLTFEEGSKLKRLLKAGTKVVLNIVSTSKVETIKSPNLVTRIEGTKKEKIVIGAHFDSWDLGDGAVDNGQGSAVIFETALLLKNLGIKPERTIEFVWFNGEESGLWGSKKYVEAHKDDSIFVMINLDMPGKVSGFNVMGFDTLKKAISEIVSESGSFNLSGYSSTAWTNSDHMYFMFAGIPVITPMGGLTPEMTAHYHDFGDTFDKVDKDYISHAAVAVAFLAEGLSRTSQSYYRMGVDDVKELLKKHNLERRLKSQEEYPF